ncbi:MAG: YraN family protein [Planctomycetes bacterium]|nr:YraN family protein [Planctomycetota bacterium]
MDGQEHLELGRRGERLAEAHLKRAGLRTISRRFSTPAGELDLVMLEADTVVFVEVKTRRDRQLAEPQDAVNAGKRRRLLKAARWFLLQRRWTDKPCRFDIVAVVVPPGGEADIAHFPDAFVPEHW